MKAFFVLIAGALSSCAIEKPDYQSLGKEGEYELRKYSNISTVSAPMKDMEERDGSFRKLFGYISGDNAGDKKIAMTAPVFMEGDNADRKPGKMSFMIPAEVTKEGAPAPDEKSLQVSEIEQGTFAVLRFKGWKKETKREKAATALAAIVKKKNLKPVGERFFAFYNPPWTPEFLRRNEVWQRVAE